MNDFYQSGDNKNLFCKFDRLTLNYLEEGAKWAKFLSVVGFILLFFVLCGALLNFSAIALISVVSPIFRNIGLLYSFFFIYLLLMLMYAFPLYYLYQASNNILLSIRAGSIKTMDSAFKYLKSHYRFIGIFTIAVLSFYVLIFVGILIFAIMNH